MSAQAPKTIRQGAQEKLAAKSDLRANISPDEARRRKLEAIERQLYYLIGQIRELKTT